MGIRSGFLHLRLVSGLILLVSLVLGAVSPGSAAGLRCYVKWNAGGLGTGASWGEAFTDLQSALAGSSCTEVWVAAGTYKPTGGTDRTISFALKNGVSLYGGFAGTETLLGQRSVAANPTILSGEIGGAGISDNSYHVVVGSDTTGTALLDGFTITAGYADGDVDLGYSSGGGMYVYSGSPGLANVTFTVNSAAIGGGGMYSELSGSVLTDVAFLSNSAAYGGGMFNTDAGDLSLKNVTFSTNSAAQEGGGMYNVVSVLSLTNVTFNDNSAQYGGGMYNIASNPTLASVTFSGNTVDLWGGGMYNILNSNPSLANVIFSGNTAGQRGGGMYNVDTSNPNLTHVTFTANLANFSGGGMYNSNSSPNLANVTFSANSAGEGFGGGMLNLSANPTLVDVVFSDNTADSGGGMYNQESSPHLTSVTFSGNLAANDGGGMYNFSSSNPILANVTFSGNSAASGGGMYNDTSSPVLTNATFNGNSAAAGGAIMGDGAILTNSILYGDNGGEISGTAGASYSIVQGGHPGTGNLDADPMLRPLGSYGGLTKTMSLAYGSPAIDAGTNTGCPAKDQRGISRPQEGNGVGTAVCDMGATESRFLTKTFQSAGSQDGWVLESTEVSGIGGTLNAGGEAFLLGDNAQDRQYRLILSYNTASLPDDATVRSVTLKIKRAGLAGTDPFATHGNLLVDVRKGAFSTSAGLQLADFQAPAGKTAVMTILNNPASGWYTRSMTAANFVYVNKAGLTQFRLRFAKDDNDDQGADTLKLYSGNALTVSNRPALVIKYYLP